MIRESHILLFSIFIAGLCSIVYELLIATTGSYFLGDSITQFSLTIGIYMAFMGIGSYVSRWIKDDTLLAQFIGFELVLALLGGSAVPLLYFAYAFGLPFQWVSGLLTALIGVLIGLEIPLLSRLMAKHYTLKANLSNVLSIDYFGALLATLLFPFLLLPWLGVFKTSLAFGLVNLSIALALLFYFSSGMKAATRARLKVGVSVVLLLLGAQFVFSHWLNKTWNAYIYEDTVVHSQQTSYQHIVMTRYKDDLRLFLNAGLQFSSIDEYRYHEALVHPAVIRSNTPKQVLILGGGDGLAVRELLKYPQIDNITLVDLDPAMAKLAKTHHYLVAQNQNAMNHEKVKVINQDGFVFLHNNSQRFDLIYIDLPDPKNVSLARLYSQQFYRSVKRSLSPQGIMVTQATSPFFARRAFWSIAHTVESAGFASTQPYHLNVPSFGEWGFVMACQSQCVPHMAPPEALKFYSPHIEPALFHFPSDMSASQEMISSLDKPEVLYYYLKGWKYWN